MSWLEILVTLSLSASLLALFLFLSSFYLSFEGFFLPLKKGARLEFSWLKRGIILQIFTSSRSAVVGARLLGYPFFMRKFLYTAILQKADSEVRGEQGLSLAKTARRAEKGDIPSTKIADSGRASPVTPTKGGVESQLKEREEKGDHIEGEAISGHKAGATDPGQLATPEVADKSITGEKAARVPESLTAKTVPATVSTEHDHKEPDESEVPEDGNRGEQISSSQFTEESGSDGVFSKDSPSGAGESISSETASESEEPESSPFRSPRKISTRELLKIAEVLFPPGFTLLSGFKGCFSLSIFRVKACISHEDPFTLGILSSMITPLSNRIDQMGKREFLLHFTPAFYKRANAFQANVVFRFSLLRFFLSLSRFFLSFRLWKLGWSFFRKSGPFQFLNKKAVAQ